MPTQIQIRRDSAADWTSNNPTLAQGEFGWETDTNRFKIGDGSSNWQNLAYASDGDTAGITFVGDDSSGTLVSQNETFKIAGGTNITTAVSGDTVTITGAGISASSTDTLTNKTFDAEGTGNALSNVDVANLKSGVLDTDISSVSGSDDTIASAKAIKTYVDAQIATKDNSDEITEGSTNLYFTNARADARITNALKDEDNMASDSATHVASQQSVKAYVDAGDLSLIDEDNFSTDSASRPPSQQSVKAYVDAQDAAIASDTLTLTNKTLTAPKFADAGFIADANGNQLIVFQTTASAVNEFDITNNATGSAPILAVTGGDTNIGMAITAKGSGDIDLNAGSDVNLPANKGLTFGDDGEKIEGDGTDLTIASSAKLNLTATSDVILPPNVGLIFDTAGAEKIESDGTDLSISVGSNGDINIPENIG